GGGLIMTDDFERFMIRHDLKAAGANPDAKVTATSLVELSKAVGEVMGKLQTRIQKLEKQLERLDHIERNALTWRGDWEPGVIYPQSTIVRHNGTLYVGLLESINKEPGAGAPWQLI